MKKNSDHRTVESFGDEWNRFDQSVLSCTEALRIFGDYFEIFPWDKLPKMASGFDMGCGTGRWARFVAPRVGCLHCIDPSSALEIAKKSLNSFCNVKFYQASVDDKLLPPNSQDFGYSLGVLHHIPDTAAAIRSCVAMLKPGAPFLIYLYYAFDNRSFLFRSIWRCSDLLRWIICRLPGKPKNFVTDLLALLIYWPLAQIARLGERLGMEVSAFPLSYYRNHSFYTMRTDSRDRFGTPLEQRFTKIRIEEMMRSAGLRQIHFSRNAPFWCAIGFKE